jgi:hypothetical protein
MVGEGKSEGGMGGGGAAMPQEGESVRVRAWVLAQAKKINATAADTAKAIWDENGPSKHMIVRADVVSGAGSKNIMVPVDAATEGELQNAVTIITNETQDTAPTIIRVTELYPKPPGRGRDPSPEEGQILGRNPWG